MSELDRAKFAKVHALINGGKTEGERSAARKKAEAMAAKAGMTLAQAVASLDAQPTVQAFSFFAGFDDWMEEKEPGWKAQKAKERAEREARDNVRKAEVLKQYGSESALFARTDREVLLDEAIEPLVSEWDHWTGDGVRHRVAVVIDGKQASGFWRADEITPAMREVVTTAYPWPAGLDEALREVKAWDRLRWDRDLFGGEWNHYAEVECRIALLEHDLEAGRPACSYADIKARFDWKRYDFERGYLDATRRDDPFMDRIEADIAAHDARLRAINEQALASVNQLDRTMRQAGMEAAARIMTAMEKAR